MAHESFMTWISTSLERKDQQSYEYIETSNKVPACAIERSRIGA